MKFPRGLFPYLLIASTYLVCALLVDPRGEFPLNDDWSYTRSAFRVGVENRLQIDEWSAPLLIGQAIYGGLLVKIFGTSFLVLRLSTLILSCAIACLLWAGFLRMGSSPGPASIAVFSWIFNPIGFCLSFSFMTEIPFLFFVMLALFFFIGYLRKERRWELAASGICLGYAFLIRQTAVLFMLPAAMALLAANPRQSLSARIGRVLVWGIGIVICLGGYAFWRLAHFELTPAANRKFELLGKLTDTQLTGNSYGMLFYLSFFMMPVLIFLTPEIRRMARAAGKGMKWLVPGFWAGISGFGFWWFQARWGGSIYLPGRALHDRMPFLLNVMYDTGLGPVTLDPTYYGPPPTPTHPQLWMAATVLVCLGLVLLGALMMLRIPDLKPAGRDFPIRALHLFTGLSVSCVAVFEVIFSHLQEGGLFDRHILTAALPLTILIVSRAGRSFRWSKPQAAAAVVAGLFLAGFAWFSIAGTHDYLAWNRARWDLGNRILATNADPLSVSGGFEFNAWHNYDAFRARGNIGKVFYWWYDRPDYLIVMEPQEGYRIRWMQEYRSWLHRRTFPVYLLERARS